MAVISLQAFPFTSSTAPSTNPRILAGYAPYGTFTTSSTSKLGGGPASTSEGRRLLLLDDPFARDVEPEQVTCTRCSKTVRLQKGKQYHLAHWLDHRWRCDRTEIESQPRPRCRTLAERKALLEADPNAKVVEPDRVVCRVCDKEVKLRKGRAYGLSGWTQHKLGCHSSTSSSVASEHSSTSSTPPTERVRLPSADSIAAGMDSSVMWNRRLPNMGVQYQAEDNACAGRTDPRFFRMRPHIDSLLERLTDPSDTEERPDVVQRAKQAALDSYKHERRSNYPGLSRSASPPPLSFSTASSASTSVVSSPMHSPQTRRKGPLLLPPSRHLAFPELPPIIGLSRLSLTKEREARPSLEKPQRSALGLQTSPSSSRHPSPTPPDTGSSMPPPPPYLERTPITLPVPERYWRFDG